MLKTMGELFSHVKNYHSFQVLPERVKSKSYPGVILETASSV